MTEYVIVDGSDPGTVLGHVSVHDAQGFAVVHDLVGTEGQWQFEDLEQVRAVLAFWRPTYEIREA
jgi:hypothetical protein